MLREIVPSRIEDLARYPEEWKGAVIAIGNFDGVHQGHQAVLQAACVEARHRGVPAIMVTFEPHPRSFFSGQPLFRLTPAPLKNMVARAFGVDGALVLKFDRSLAELSAQAFVETILMSCLKISHAVVGYDFQFGKNRQGTPSYLQDAGLFNGFGVTVVGEFDDFTGMPVSSTRIRSILYEGNVKMAADLLGWTWSVTGEVRAGDKRGRDLGYPTANMALDPECDLAHGIYAVRYTRPDGVTHNGVASYGRRPTFDNGAPVLETFLFDFSGDLYGEPGLVSFVAHLRAETRFESVEALVRQMDKDSLDARAHLERARVGDLDRAIAAEFASAALRH